MAGDDLRLIKEHLAALRGEVAELNRVVEETAQLEREATLQEVFDVLSSAIDALVRSQGNGEPAAAVVERLAAALPKLGLSPNARVGEVLELWPEEAKDDLFALDAVVPPDAAMVRVEVLASGWQRGNKIVARPLGRILEVIQDDDDAGKAE